MFAQYPYLNLNDFNLDYILKAIKDMRYEVTNFVSINAIKYADPIQWNITSQYEKNTIVIDPVTGTAYISVAAVPAGVALTRPEYWTVVFDLQSFVTKANQNLANNYEAQTTTTATMNTAAGEWVIWGDILYKALVNITAGDAYVVGSNIQRIVIEDVINAIMQDIADEAQARQNADTTLQGAIDDEVQARQNADTALSDRINDEVQARQDADAALQEEIESHGQLVTPQQYGAVGDGTTDDTQAFIAAVNSGNSIYIPDGNYKITSPITLPDNCSIIGASYKKSKILCYNCGGFIINPNWGAQIENVFMIEYASDGTAYQKMHTAIKCNGTAPGDDSVNFGLIKNVTIHGFNVGIDLRYTWNFVLESDSIILTNICVQLFGQSINNTINNCTLTAFNNSSTIGDSSGSASVLCLPDDNYTSEGLVISNSFLTSGAYGVIALSNILALQVVNSLIDLVTKIGVYIHGVECIITNNWINADEICLNIANIGSPRDCLNKISNNTFVADGTGKCVNVGYYNNKNIIDGNTCYCTETAIYLDSYDTDNIISNNIIHHITSTTASSIYVSSDGNKIVNNISNTNGYLVQLASTVNTSILNGNRIINAEFTAKPTAGTWKAGDIVLFKTPVNNYIGAVCTVAGTPGTWKYFAALEP